MTSHSPSSNSFYTNENLRVITNIFKTYMLEKYDFTIPDESKSRKLIFDVMTNVNEKTKGQTLDIKKLNNNVLNIVCDFYLKRFDLEEKPKKPNIQVLSREKSIYGNRQLHTSILVPDVDPYTKKGMDTVHISQANMERLLLERDRDIGIEKKPNLDAEKVIKPVTEKSESEEIFLKRLQDFESQRRLIIDDLDLKRSKNEQFSQLLPETIPNTLLHFISISSSDRNLVTNPLRYKYMINFSQNKYKNICSVFVGKIIIPEYLTQPYLLLLIDEFTDVYDGINDVLKKAFCKLLYYKSYQSQDGRSYTILKPAQKETKIFQPLYTFQKLSISLIKPNGELLNNGHDSYFIKKLEHNKQKANLILITCEHFFDNNEFNVNDLITIKDFEMKKLSTSQKELDLQELNAYINRSEGFKIIERGPINEHGYCNSFYIPAPFTFNPILGLNIIKTNITNCLDLYNKESTPFTNGFVLNLSLQNSIALNFTTAPITIVQHS